MKFHIEMQADPLIREMATVTNNLTKQLRIVSWNVSKKTKSLISKAIHKELATSQKNIKKNIKTERLGKTGALVDLEKSERMSLKDFKPRQTKKGVSYRISKSTGRTMRPGSFLGPRPGLTTVKLGGHVFKRRGTTRKPIVKLRGPSPWGVYTRKGMKVTLKINQELRKQLARRVNYLTLKKAGAI